MTTDSRNRISEDLIFKISQGQPHTRYHKPGSAPGNGRVTSVIYRNGEEKAAIRWSFEIGIGGEGDKKFCDSIFKRQSHIIFKTLYVSQ